MVRDHLAMTLLIGGSSYMKLWAYPLSVFLCLLVSFASIPDVQAQARSGHQNVASETNVTNDHQEGHASERWEGSPEGKAFSEFAHHFAGSFDVIFGLAELGCALQYPLPYWTRFILPGALSIVGGFTLIWSDHDAWPIGSLSFMETFFGEDREIIEHKSYGILTLAIAFFEMLRRTGKVRHPAWAAPLVLLVLVSALSLFDHSHGNHPAAAKIQFHHSLLGIVGVGAAFSKGLASWLPGASPQLRKWWEIAWAGSIILFGLLLLAYYE
jgi:putative copper resistance protein D